MKMEDLMQTNITGITLECPIFQGLEDKNALKIADFLNQFETAAEKAGLTTDDQKALHFGNYLKGAPFCLYENLSISRIDQTEWKAVKNYFLTKYQIQEEVTKLKTERTFPEIEKLENRQCFQLKKDIPEGGEQFKTSQRRKRKRKKSPLAQEINPKASGIKDPHHIKDLSKTKGGKGTGTNEKDTIELIASLTNQKVIDGNEANNGQTGNQEKKLNLGSVTHLMGKLIHNTIFKLESSLKQDKQRPMVHLNVNGWQIKALFDTGAQITCMKQSIFNKIFPASQKPKQLRTTGNVTAADGQQLKQIGTYQLPFTFNGKNYEYPCKVLGNLNEDMIVGINFMHLTGLSYDAGRKELFLSNAESNWRTASMQINEEITLEPLTCAVVTVNALTRDLARPGIASSAIAVVNSNDYVLSGGPAIVQLNQFGQAQMEIFNCTADPMTILKDSIIGMIEKLHPDEEASIAVLNVDEMVATLENNELPEKEKLTKEKEMQLRRKVEQSVPAEFRKQYLDLCLEYHEIFNTVKRDLGPNHTAFHDINLRDEEPVYIKQFRIPEAHRSAVEDHVKEMLKLGCIRPTRSKFNSPIFVVPQMDGGLRIVQDFRALNQKTVNNQHSMKDIQEHIDDIGKTGSRVFSNLDLTSGLWQMLLNPESRKYTAFTVPGLGQFEWIRSPMSLLGATGSFQKLLEITIHNLTNTIAYMDSLLVHTQSHEDHLRILEQVLKRMRQGGLRANLEKTTLGQDEIEYLGYRISSEGSIPGVDKLKAVRDALPPTDVAEIRQFLGLCNFFKNHLRNYAVISAPLSNLAKRESKWKNGTLPAEAMKAFTELKMMMTSAPIVHHPQPQLRYALITDACQGDAKKPGGYGAILAQILPDGEFQVISYASRVLTEIEKNYAPFLLEMSASVWAMRHFSHYLKGRHFVLYTDHKPLIKLGSVHNKNLNDIQKAMLEFDFEIVHLAGKEMPADFLSRNVVGLINFDNDKWKQAQEEEPWIQQCKEWLLTGKVSTHPYANQFMRPDFARSLFIDDDLLWRRYHCRGEPSRVCLVIPEKFAQQVLNEGHGTIFTGHEGVGKTKSRIMQHYWWRCMDSTIAEFIKHCEKCQKNRKFNHPTPSLLTPLPQCTEPNQRIHADLFGTLKAPARSKKYILCITDAFTKYVELIVVPDKEAETVSEAIFIHWILRYGIPMEIFTDQGKEFCNKLSDELYELLNVKHNTTTAYHPQCNAQAEVANKTIQKYLQSFVDSTTLDWENYIAPMMFAYNTSFHRTIQTSPHFLTFGSLARQPAFAPTDLREKYYETQSEKERFQTLQEAREIAWKNSMHQHETYQQQYDRKAAPHDFEVNQWVLLQENYFLNKNAKLSEKYSGPFKIVQLKGTNNAIIQVKKKKVCVNTNRLKPYHDSSNFVTFSKNFEKQGSDPDKSENEKQDTESENEDVKLKSPEKPKRKRGRPRKSQPEEMEKEKQREEDKWELERERIRNQLRMTDKPEETQPERNPPPRIQESESESETESENEANSDTDTADEGSEDEESQNGKPRLFIPQIMKSVSAVKELHALMEKKIQEKLIQKLKTENQAVNGVWQRENPIKEYYRNLIKNAPPNSHIALIKKRFPGWTEAQLINFLYSQGDINHSPDDPKFISLEQSGSIPREFYEQFEHLRIPPAVINPPAIGQPVIDWEDEAEDLVDQVPLLPPLETKAPIPGGSRNQAQVNLTNVRPELQFGNFKAASAVTNLNPDEEVFFKNKFYGWSARHNKELVQEQGRPTRSNESGIRTHLKKK